MAYVQNEDEMQQGMAGGQVLAGSGGAAAGTSQPAAGTGQAVGTGFTNLQKYLGANQGQGQGIAGDITSQGQKAVDTARTAADTQATTWADAGVQKATNGAQEAVASYNQAADTRKNTAFDQQVADPSATYGGPKTAQDVDGFNDLDKAYQNVKTTATNYAGDFNTQKAGLQQKNGYGGGFAALDTFLGRQDGKEQIQGWAAGVTPGSADAQVARVNSAIADGQKQVTDARDGFQSQVTAKAAEKTAYDAEQTRKRTEYQAEIQRLMDAQAAKPVQRSGAIGAGGSREKKTQTT